MNILTWDGSSDKYISLPTLTVVGDFEVSFIMELDRTATQYRANMGDGAYEDWFGSDDYGMCYASINGDMVASSDGLYPDDGAPHTLKITRVGSTISFYMDDNFDSSSSGSTANLNLDRFGVTGGLHWFEGLMPKATLTGNINGSQRTLIWEFQDGWSANPMIEETGVGGGTFDGTAVGFTSGMWTEIIIKLRRILLNMTYGIAGTTPEPEDPPEPGGDGAEAWILDHFSGSTLMTGFYNDRETVYTDTLLNNVTGEITNDEKYLFDLRENTGSSNKGVGIMNTTIGQMTSFSAYGAPIVIKDGVEEVFMFNVTLEPNWPDWIDYDNTNYDAVDCDEPCNLYIHTMVIDNWNADAGLDMKAQHAEIVNLTINGGGHRSLRIWSLGDVFLMDSTLGNDTGDDILWFGEFAKVSGHLYIWNCDFEGNSTCPAGRIGDDGPGTPNITYLTEDPRLPGSPHYPLHPMFD